MTSNERLRTESGAAAPQKPAWLEVRGIVKRFPGVRALDNVQFDLHVGEVLAVVGENGAGKSTLMKILAGVETPDEGEIRCGGRSVRIDSVRAAAQLGIALIHQELNLADNLDVRANLFLGHEPQRWGFVQRRQIDAAAEAMLAKVGLKVSPRTCVGDLSPGQQQLVEIAKALGQQARVLIMDEPTSSLSQRESETLFGVVDDLRRQGVSIIYISHRLGEVRCLADRALVLRDGRNAGELSRNEITHDNLVRLMVGRDLNQFYARKQHTRGGTALSVEGLRTSAHPEHTLSFSVAAGEMVALAGLVGAGRTEVLTALFGIEPAQAGKLLIHGREVTLDNPRAAIRAGLMLVPEDRKLQGLVLSTSVEQNISLAGLFAHRLPGGGINRRRAAQDTRAMIDQLHIKTPSPQQEVQFLSGGNQQKVVLGKWLPLAPRVLLLDEPTRGIDVGGKQEIYRLMENLAEQGVAVLFASSELEEVLGMADRVLVLHEGRLTGELARDQLSEEAIMHLATGAEPDALPLGSEQR